MFFWHLGGTVAIIRYAFRDERMDLRPLLVGSLLPDMIDKPVVLAAYDNLMSVRLVGHSLLFSAVLMTGVLVMTRRGRPRKRWMPLAVGVLVHLFLDAMWTSPETLWWPFLGFDFTPTAATGVGDYTADLMRSPWMWAGEVIGLAYLANLFVRGGLRARSAREAFVKSGRLDVPIERRP